jgi:hypothetical protein
MAHGYYHTIFLASEMAAILLLWASFTGQPGQDIVYYIINLTRSSILKGFTRHWTKLDDAKLCQRKTDARPF